MCAKQNPSYHLGFSLSLSINAQLTLHHKWPSPHNFKKKYLEIQKKLIPLRHVEVTTIINPLKFITIMQKFIISVKDKNTGRDVISPYIVNSLDGLGNYSERVSPLGLIVIVDSIKEENDFVDLKIQSNEK